MEIVCQARTCLTKCRHLHLQCGCVQERHFKGTTALILKAGPETVDASYLGNASFSMLTIKEFLYNMLSYSAKV